MRFPEKHLMIELRNGNAYVINTDQVHWFITPTSLHVYDSFAFSEYLEIKTADIKNLHLIRRAFQLPDHLLVPPLPTPDPTTQLEPSLEDHTPTQPTTPNNIIE